MSRTTPGTVGQTRTAGPIHSPVRKKKARHKKRSAYSIRQHRRRLEAAGKWADGRWDEVLPSPFPK